jgi:ribonuclease P protein component
VAELQTDKFYLKKENILRERKDFKKAFFSGRKLENKYLQVIYTYNSLGNRRIAVVLGRKFGKANLRNKIRRRIKEAYRLNMQKFPSYTDYIIRPRDASKYISFYELKDNLLQLIEKCIRRG